jgi:DNA-binding MltR family transcriptional regulator
MTAKRVYLDLEKESDRAAAVLCASFLDHELEQLLKRFMRDIKETHQLFHQMQPLSTFSAKIKFSYVLGLISDIMYCDLGIIRKIRNDFAHDREISSFEEVRITERCMRLQFPEILKEAHPNYPKTARERFECATKMLLGTVCTVQQHAYSEKRSGIEETKLNFSNRKFKADDLIMSAVCYGSEHVGGLNITFADSLPIEITWDNPDDMEKFAENLKGVSLMMRN